MGKLFANIVTALIPVEKWRRAVRKKMLDSSHVTRKEFREFRRRFDSLPEMLLNPDGLGRFRFLLGNISHNHRFDGIFYALQSGDVCVDCGMHAGMFTDLVLMREGIVYGFEPNPRIFPFLSAKYRTRNDVTCVNKAVGAAAGKEKFYFNDALDSPGAGMTKVSRAQPAGECEVDCVRLTEYLRTEILSRHERIHILKLDVEGAEFQIIPDLIESGVHEKIDHILCETHARFFDNGPEMLGAIERMIRERGITNIDLNWM